MKKYALNIKPFLATIAIVLAVRYLIFCTPYPWRYFQTLISNSQYLTVGRQKGIIEMNANMNVKRESKYLAFGNSQTAHIYHDQASLEKFDIEVFELPGLQIHEYSVYTDILSNYETENVLLFLSDIDMACNPNMTRLKFGPVDFDDIFRLKEVFETYNYKYDSREFADLIIGEFLPEYKYAFVFKAIVKDLFLAPKKPFNRDINKRSSKKMIKETIKEMRRRKTRRFDEKNIDFSISELELFLDYCSERDWTVYIVEGQYINDTYAIKPEYRKKVSDKIIESISEYSDIYYIPRDSVYQLGPDDWRDNVHIYGDQSHKVIQSIIAYIEGE